MMQPAHTHTHTTATSLCFQEKNVYTAEVLAVAMQLLSEMEPIPTLFMRSMIQSVTFYPRLVGFMMNILQRLIPKQVWTQKKVWEGFIKCCQRTRPQSFAVLLQLPAAPLASVFQSCPELKVALQQHVAGFSEEQRGQLPQSMLDAIFEEQEPEPQQAATIEEPAAE